MFFKDSAEKINAREIFKAVCGKDAPTEVRFLLEGRMCYNMGV